jgi:hypothetical protein
MPNDWSAEKTDNPHYADRRTFYKVEKWSRGVKGADCMNFERVWLG